MSSNAGPDIVQDGLVLCLDPADKKSYPGSGTSVTDRSGNGNDGSMIGGLSFASINKGVFQIGADNSHKLRATGMPTGNTWSILIWSFVDGPTEFEITGHRTYAATDCFRFQWDDSNSSSVGRGPFVNINTNDGGISASFQPSTFNTQTVDDLFNKWVLTSMTSDGSSLKIYLSDEEGYGSISARDFSTDGILDIGIDNLSGIGGSDRFNKDGGNCYFGPIMVYNRGLSTTEVLQNYRATRSRFS